MLVGEVLDWAFRERVAAPDGARTTRHRNGERGTRDVMAASPGRSRGHGIADDQAALRRAVSVTGACGFLGADPASVRLHLVKTSGVAGGQAAYDARRCGWNGGRLNSAPGLAGSW